MHDPLADLRVRFAARTLDRISALREAVERVGIDADAPAQIVSLAHQLAGSAGTFGYAALSEAAASLEATARHQCDAIKPLSNDTLRRPLASIEACTQQLAAPL